MARSCGDCLAFGRGRPASRTLAMVFAASMSLACSVRAEAPAAPAAPPQPATQPAAITPAPATQPAEVEAFLTKHQLKGKIALVEFGVVGYPLSDTGLDEMVRLHKAKAAADLAFVRVEIGKETPTARDYYEKKSLPFPLHWDSDAALAKALDVTVDPTFVLLDKFGRVRSKGNLPKQENLVEWVRLLGAESADPGPNVPLFGTVKLDIAKLLKATNLPNLSDRTRSLDAFLGRGGLLLVFVDTSCPFAEIAVGDMPTVTQALRRHGVSTVLVNLDDPAEAVRKYYKTHKAQTPVVFDETTRTKVLWGMTSVPTVVLIGANRELVYNGKAVWQDVADAGEKAMGLARGSLGLGAAQGTGFG